MALITGITGRDGSYLPELVLEKGYEVHGLVRRPSNETKVEDLARLMVDADLELIDRPVARFFDNT